VDPLVRIKQAVLSGRVIFTRKADLERDADDLTVQDVYESIINAHAIDKVLRSTSSRGRGDKLYVIKGLTFANTLVYTKGYPTVTRCPICGSTRIKTVRGGYQTSSKGKPLTVPDVERQECPHCGEVLLDTAAMRKLELARSRSRARRSA
jgi:YgiT-type zinc finger domain-containing protein